jgi:NAD(P) transhydrogenase
LRATVGRRTLHPVADYELICIRSGPAGEKAAALAAYHGHRVAVVEQSPQLGGAMVNGVVTTKTMREAALYLTGFRQRDVYGVGMRLDPAQAFHGVHDRATRVEALLAAQVADNLRRHGIDVLAGRGRLAGPGRVEVTGDGRSSVYSVDKVILATGSRPFHPPGIAFDHPDVLDSDTAGGLDRPVPEVVVVGGGAVACEYASILAALGSRVTLVESRGVLLPFMDRQVSDLLAATFRDLGVRVLLGAGHAQVDADGSGVRVRLDDGTVLRPDKVVVAAGRVGNTEALGLETCGVATDERGLVVVDEHYATTAPDVYAAGDATGPPALASVSMEQGRIAACAAFGIPTRTAVDGLPPCGVYSIPEVGMVGLTEEAAREAGHDVEVGVARLAGNARTAINGGHSGVVKLVFRRDDQRLLGAHVIGDAATELVHQAQAVMHFGGSLRYFIDATFNVPTESEVFKYAAYAGLSRLENREVIAAGI